MFINNIVSGSIRNLNLWKYNYLLGSCSYEFFFLFLRYKGNDVDDLSELRYNTFMRFAATATTTIKPQSLPPTARAAYFHSLRVHLQVIEWKSLMRVTLPAEDWGWKLQHGMYEPIMTDLAPAPEKILKCVRCNCKLMGKNVCGTNACTCKKIGLWCISACGQCYGKNCHNAKDNMSSEEMPEDSSNILGII